MRLILVRHPKPACEPGLCYGRTDLACEPAALEEAAVCLAEMAAPCAIVSSPARRAFDLARRLGDGVTVEPRLQELDFGDWEAFRWADIGREPIDLWREGLPDSAPPNGESLTALAERCASWLSDISMSETQILAVTHAGPIRVIRALLQGEPLLTYFSSSVAFAQPLILEFNRLF
jgi:alpha-ribazole phosphatase